MRRVDLIASLVNGLSLAKTLGKSVKDSSEISKIYEDWKDIPAYATEAVAYATIAKIVVNHPNPTLLHPKREAKRADAIAFIYQALVKTGRFTEFNSPYSVVMSHES